MLVKIPLVKVFLLVYSLVALLAKLVMQEREGEPKTMSKDKKAEKANKPRSAVYVDLNKQRELHQWLEDERNAQGGDATGVKMPQVVRGKLKRQMESERGRKK